MFYSHQNNHQYLKISGCWNHPAVANFTEIPNSMLVALQCPSHTILILIVWDFIRNFQSTVASNCINLIQDGLFRGCSRMWGVFLPPLPKICHTYPTMMKLDTVIPYLKKIQKIYESRDTPLEFC